MLSLFFPSFPFNSFFFSVQKGKRSGYLMRGDAQKSVYEADVCPINSMGQKI